MADLPPALPTLRAAVEHLEALAAPLTADQVEAPSFCDDWSIAQVLSHLGSQAEIMSSFVAAAVAGEPEPSNEAFQPIWDRWNALSPVEQKTQALAGVAKAVATLEQLDATAGPDFRIRLFGGAFDLDVPGFAAFRLGEHALHTWDIAVAIDPAATLDVDAVALIVDQLPRLVGHVMKGDDHQRIGIELSTPTSSWVLSTGDGGGLAPADGQPVDGTVQTSAEVFVRLAYGRLVDTDRLEVDGGVTRASLVAAFPGV